MDRTRGCVFSYKRLHIVKLKLLHGPEAFLIVFQSSYVTTVQTMSILNILILCVWSLNEAGCYYLRRYVHVIMVSNVFTTA